MFIVSSSCRLASMKEAPCFVLNNDLGVSENFQRHYKFPACRAIASPSVHSSSMPRRERCFGGRFPFPWAIAGCFCSRPCEAAWRSAHQIRSDRGGMAGDRGRGRQSFGADRVAAQASRPARRTARTGSRPCPRVGYRFTGEIDYLDVAGHRRRAGGSRPVHRRAAIRQSERRRRAALFCRWAGRGHHHPAGTPSLALRVGAQLVVHLSGQGGRR